MLDMLDMLCLPWCLHFRGINAVGSLKMSRYGESKFFYEKTIGDFIAKRIFWRIK